MANQKPVDEIRIGRVKATLWKNGTEDQPRYNVTFSRLYKEGDQWKSTQSFSRNDLLVLAKSSRLRPHAPLPASGRSRTPGGAGKRVLAGNRARARREPFASPRLFFFFPLRLSVCLWCLSARSGPPLAASQGNSRARMLRSLSASVTRVVLSGPCPSPRARSSLLLWFVVLPLPLVKGKHSKPSKETP